MSSGHCTSSMPFTQRASEISIRLSRPINSWPEASKFKPELQLDLCLTESWATADTYILKRG